MSQPFEDIYLPPSGDQSIVISTAEEKTSAAELDQALRRRVEAVLAARHIPVLRRLSVETNQGIVTLRGVVHTFYEKQVSQLSAQRVAGVRQVQNLVEVEITPLRVTSLARPDSRSRVARQAE